MVPLLGNFFPLKPSQVFMVRAVQSSPNSSTLLFSFAMYWICRAQRLCYRQAPASTFISSRLSGCVILLYSLIRHVRFFDALCWFAGWLIKEHATMWELDCADMQERPLHLSTPRHRFNGWFNLLIQTRVWSSLLLSVMCALIDALNYWF